MDKELKPQTVNDLLQWAVIFLGKDKRIEAELLLAHAINFSRAKLIAYPEKVLNLEEQHKFIKTIQLRKEGEPLQYLLGTEDFMGLEFKVTKDVLIPRSDTEVMVEKVIEYVQNMQKELTRQEDQATQIRKNLHNPQGTQADQSSQTVQSTQDKQIAQSTQDKEIIQVGQDTRQIQILDLCTGSGAIAVSLAKHLPNTKLTALDISDAALEIAKSNAKLNGVENKIEFYQGDLFEPLRKRITTLKGNLNQNIKKYLPEGPINSTKATQIADIKTEDIKTAKLKIAASKFHIIVSNPPYITSGEMKDLPKDVHKEPHLALWGGVDGLDFYRKIIKEAPYFLEENGRLFLEIGYKQAKEVSLLLEEKGFKDIEIIQDWNKLDRVVSGVYF